MRLPRLVVAAPASGQGKTTVAVEAVVAAVARGEVSPDECLVLTSTRLAAATVRDRVTARVGSTSTEPLARTHQSFGFGVLRRLAALAGDPAPRLLSGPEQDVILRDLLAGYADGAAPAPPWPRSLDAALPTRGFRAELRDLLMRAVERGLEPEDLDVFVPHQANNRITDSMLRHLGLPEKVVVARDITHMGNSSAASVPLAMEALLESGAAKSGDLALTIGFGAGLVYAGQVVRLP